MADVWAIGGGKGGTGKSFVSSSMGLCLAEKGKSVVMIDADLGGANLHSFLGVKRPSNTLTDFFEKKVPLADLVMPTNQSNLYLITGDLQSLDTDDVKHTQKLKFFRHIKTLQADYVLVDLGAGAHYNTLDSFLEADQKIVVTMPAVTALENLYHFIKNAYYRKLKSAFGAHGMKDTVTGIWRNRDAHNIKNLRGLVEHLRGKSPEMAAILSNDLDNFTLNIIINQVKDEDDAKLGPSVKSVLRKYLGFSAEFSGQISQDNNVLRCLNRAEPYVRTCTTSLGVKEIHAITNKILAASGEKYEQ